MRRRTYLALTGVTLSGALGGCMGDGGDSENGDENGGGDTENGEANGNGETPGYLDEDWGSEDGLDFDTLLDAHVQALVEAGSFSLSLEENVSGLSEPIEATTEVSGSIEQERIYQQGERSEQEQLEVYVSDETRYLRNGPDDTDPQTQPVDDFESNFRGAALPTDRIEQIRNFVFEYDQLTQQGGEDVYRFEASEIMNPDEFSAEPEDASATLLVRPSGLMPNFEYLISFGDDGEQELVYELSDIGSTTVEQPDWV